MQVQPCDALKQVTPLVITYNEDPNIGRSLEGLRKAECILVIDSGSTDRTLELLAKVPRVEVVHRPFDSFAEQCNFGLSLIRTPWCLSLDADHPITTDFQAELAQLFERISGSDRRGHPLPLSGGRQAPARHPAAAPHKPDASRRRPLRKRRPLRSVHAVRAHRHHARAGAPRRPQTPSAAGSPPSSATLGGVPKLLTSPAQQLSFSDRLHNRHLIAPFAALLVCLILQRGLLDGWRGWFYASSPSTWKPCSA